MALITCPECKKKISDSANKCPNCGFQLSHEAIAEIKAKDQKNNQASGIGCLALIVIVFVIGLLTYDQKENPETGRETLAFIHCQNFVTQRLKAPSTADFPHLDRKSWKIDENTFAIQAYVDAQNSFGAKIRTNWTCEIKYNGGDQYSGANWQLLSLKMLQ